MWKLTNVMMRIIHMNSAYKLWPRVISWHNAQPEKKIIFGGNFQKPMWYFVSENEWAVKRQSRYNEIKHISFAVKVACFTITTSNIPPWLIHSAPGPGAFAKNCPTLTTRATKSEQFLCSSTMFWTLRGWRNLNVRLWPHQTGKYTTPCHDLWWEEHIM